MSGDHASLFITFFSGLFFLILITPGPNIIMIGCLSALYGLRSIFPILLGITTGQIVLATGFYGLFQLMPVGPAWDALSNGLAALLIALIAWRLYAASSLNNPDKPNKILASAQFLSSFITAASNPITGLYFASQFLGPLKDVSTLTFSLLLLLSFVFEIFVYGIIAILLSREAIRAQIKSKFSLWTRMTAVALFFIAFRHLEPAIAFATGLS